MIRIEMVALGAIAPADLNPKDHDIDGTRASIREFGFDTPPLRNDTTGKLIAGHGRIEALRLMQAAGEPAPRHVEDRDDDWYVPVICGAEYDVHNAKVRLLNDNRLTERGGWRDADLRILLTDIIQTQGIEITPQLGWSVDELRQFDIPLPNELPDFQPGTASEQSKLDETTGPVIVCPHCAHEFTWKEKRAALRARKAGAA
jgi:hypothetical protein